MRGVILGIVLSVLGAGLALASHEVSLSFSANPAVAGTTVVITAGSTTQVNQLQLAWCLAWDEAEDQPAVPVQPVSSASCADGSGDWVELRNEFLTGDDFSYTHDFDTSPWGGYTIGFRVQQPPIGGHSDSRAIDDLVIQVPSSDDTHAGCRGIENAYGKVSDQGRAKASLEAVADKLGCDLGG
jgi:hypothetical protein